MHRFSINRLPSELLFLIHFHFCEVNYELTCYQKVQADESVDIYTETSKVDLKSLCNEVLEFDWFKPLSVCYIPSTNAESSDDLITFFGT